MPVKFTQEHLHRVISYDPETGKFTRLITTSSNANSGEDCGNKDSQGYLRFRVLGQEFRAHRLAVFYMTGEWPAVTDHINGDRTDNRWSNIRVTDSKGNARNLSTRHDNKSGHKGVTWDTKREKWLVQIGRDGNKITIGRYKNLGLAVAIAKAAYEYLAPDVTHRAAMLQGSQPVSNRDELQVGWIKCSDRMPSKLIPVMVMYEDGEMWSAIWSGQFWDDGSTIPDPRSITHWREMPAAPQQEAE